MPPSPPWGCGRTGSTRRFAWRTRAGPTGWSSSRRARSTPYDSRTAALAFAEAFRQLAPDLVLTGVQTPYRRVRSNGALPRRDARLAAGERRRRSHAGRRNRARRAGVRRRAARRARPPAAGCRRRAIRKLTAPVRGDGPAPPGDDRSKRRDARRQRRGARRGVEAHLARSADAAGPGDDARGRRRAGRPRRSLAVLRERGALAG